MQLTPLVLLMGLTFLLPQVQVLQVLIFILIEFILKMELMLVKNIIWKTIPFQCLVLLNLLAQELGTEDI